MSDIVGKNESHGLQWTSLLKKCNNNKKEKRKKSADLPKQSGASGCTSICWYSLVGGQSRKKRLIWQVLFSPNTQPARTLRVFRRNLYSTMHLPIWRQYSILQIEQWHQNQARELQIESEKIKQKKRNKHAPAIKQKRRAVWWMTVSSDARAMDAYPALQLMTSKQRLG